MRLVRSVATGVLAVLALACGNDVRGPSPYVIPGPSVPSPIPTAPPYVWDSHEELAIWTENVVARGSLAVVGNGREAFIRIDRADREWLVRGPDLTPPATGVQTLRIVYRWRPDATLPPNAVRVVRAYAHFQGTYPIVGYDPLAQGAAAGNLEPQTDWTEATFVPSQYRPPIEITHCYLHSYGTNSGVFEIDRLELVRQ